MLKRFFLIFDCDEQWLAPLRFVLERSGIGFEVITGRSGLDRIPAQYELILVVPAGADPEVVKQLKQGLAKVSMRAPYLIGVSDHSECEIPEQSHCLLDLVYKGSMDMHDALQVILSANEELDLQHSIENWKLPISESKKNLYQQAKGVRKLQRQMMPSQGQQFPGFRTYHASIPMFVVSGDHCSAFQIDDHTTGFCLLDVVGHGIASGIKALGVARLLSTDPAEGIVFGYEGSHSDKVLLEPHQALQKLNQIYQSADSHDTYFAVAYGFYNSLTRTLKYCVAGIPSLVVLNAQGQVKTLDANDVPVGLFDDHEYQTHALQIEKNDRLLLLSDGLVEAMTPDYDLFGETRLLEVIHRHAGQTNQLLFDEIIAAALNWQGEGTSEFQDDITVMCLAFDEQDQGLKIPHPSNARVSEKSDILTELTTQVVEKSSARINPCVLVFTGPDTCPREIDSLSAHCRAFGLELLVCPRTQMIPSAAGMDFLHVACVAFLSNTPHPDKLKYLLLLKEQIRFSKVPMVLDLAVETVQQTSSVSPNELAAFYLKVSNRNDLSFWLQKVKLVASQYMALELRNQKAKEFTKEFEQDLKKIASLQAMTLQKCRRSRQTFSTGYVYQPGHLVSGDFVGVFRVSNHVFSLLMIDSSGQGVLPATLGWALYRMVAGVTGQHQLTIEGFDQIGQAIPKPPAQVLLELNQKTLEQPSQAQSTFTVTYALFDELSGQLVMSMAGAPAAVIQKNNAACQYVRIESPKLGVTSVPHYENLTFQLDQGDRLFIASDGLFHLAGVANANHPCPVQMQPISQALQQDDLKTTEALLSSILANSVHSADKDATALILENRAAAWICGTGNQDHAISSSSSFSRDTFETE
ncbi:MAG: SpoIIE family protein phosphatase [Limnobacter sp.]|nr:SpoIIE family protein phosphatase [Limnobacter sp.]